ncbi:uncharacterized protein LOC129227001 [Uloborus diversus]|uniref:uncharacterized protein LOC129227001 n=1 Tax=Uloborus diversus TaxID=327109 RepID=UPI00240A2B90|nr:uncharacterized protein LOC129227001 [Uloborus diversus]
MWSFWGVLFLVSYAFAAPFNGTEVPFVEPEVLEQLLKNGEFEEFSKLMGIENVNLVIPREGNEDPMYHKELPLGDVLVRKNQLEEGRVVINFDKYPGSKWPNGVVPYRIASDGYSKYHIIVYFT